MLIKYLKKILNDILFPFSGIFTALTLFFGICSNGLTKTPAIPVKNLFILALFSFILSLLNRVFYLKKLNVYLSIAIHGIFSTLAIYLLMLIFTNHIVNVTENLRLILVIFYVIIYLIAAFTFTAINETRKFRAADKK